MFCLTYVLYENILKLISRLISMCQVLEQCSVRAIIKIPILFILGNIYHLICGFITSFRLY
jgi:hypothetical protein